MVVGSLLLVRSFVAFLSRPILSCVPWSKASLVCGLCVCWGYIRCASTLEGVWVFVKFAFLVVRLSVLKGIWSLWLNICKWASTSLTDTCECAGVSESLTRCCEHVCRVWYLACATERWCFHRTSCQCEVRFYRAILIVFALWLYPAIVYFNVGLRILQWVLSIIIQFLDNFFP